MKYTTVIGLEVHCELLTDSKLFCSCKNGFGSTPNTRVCPVCCGMPGTLPSLNKNAVLLAAKAGLILNCNINKRSSFDRKNYFYPDSPKSYQITQFYNPLCSNGYVELDSKKQIRIKQIHLEDDAGKLIHRGKTSLIDFNRCGVPLIEIVTEPDFRSADEVTEFVKLVSQNLRYANICDGRMEQGSLRVDVNISLMPHGSSSYGTRAEIKNLNSNKSIVKAIDFEIKRQAKLLDNSDIIVEETRRFDESTGITHPLRSKEASQDYRYFPEPDIPDVILSDKDINTIYNSIPELPRARKNRYIKEYGLKACDASLIVSDKYFSDFYDKCVDSFYKPQLIANLMLGEISRCINTSDLTLSDSKLSPQATARTAQMLSTGIISNNSAKEILKELFFNGGNADDTANIKGFILNNDTTAISNAINEFFAKNSELITEYKSGQEKLFGFIMGQVVRSCGNSASPILIKEVLIQKLKES